MRDSCLRQAVSQTLSVAKIEYQSPPKKSLRPAPSPHHTWVLHPKSSGFFSARKLEFSMTRFLLLSYGRVRAAAAGKVVISRFQELTSTASQHRHKRARSAALRSRMNETSLLRCGPPAPMRRLRWSAR